MTCGLNKCGRAGVYSRLLVEENRICELPYDPWIVTGVSKRWCNSKLSKRQNHLCTVNRTVESNKQTESWPGYLLYTSLIARVYSSILNSGIGSKITLVSMLKSIAVMSPLFIVKPTLRRKEALIQNYFKL